jgi:hypothetical protein
MVDFNAKVKAKAFPKQEIYQLISSCEGEDIRVYLAMSFAMANRSGELLPYQHYKTTYKKDSDGRLLQVAGDKGNYAVLDTKTPTWVSQGVNVSDIEYEYDSEGKVELIVIKRVPVFKTKQMSFGEGYIYRVGNPLFDEIVAWINKRKALVTLSNPLVYLFELPEGRTPERFFWSFKKRVQKEVRKHLVGNLIQFKLHSLRSSRATDASEASGGDVFYVQAITRHRDVRNLQQYVQPVHMKRDIKKYEGGR